MIDIRRLLAGLTRAIGSADFPDAKTLATVLGLDISQARITKTKQGNMGINGARLNHGTSEVGIVCGITPRREIWILFDSPSIPYRDVKDEIFGGNQRIIPSKLSLGFGVLFEIDGWTCGYTASSPDGNIESLSCEAPRPSLAG